jgi:hypothetical protein
MLQPLAQFPLLGEPAGELEPAAPEIEVIARFMAPDALAQGDQAQVLLLREDSRSCSYLVAVSSAACFQDHMAPLLNPSIGVCLSATCRDAYARSEVDRWPASGIRAACHSAVTTPWGADHGSIASDQNAAERLCRWGGRCTKKMLAALAGFVPPSTLSKTVSEMAVMSFPLSVINP